MKKTAYIRVSTGKQTFDRQLYKLNEYFRSMGINPADIDIVSEKISSHTNFTERKIYDVLTQATEGDIIYACQLDRLGRSTIDILELVSYATSKGVVLMTVEPPMTFENKSAMGKLVLGVLSAVAETERELRAERCQAGVEAAKEEIRRNGYRISRISGKIQTRWGNKKGVDMSAAQAASARQKADSLMAWKEQSVGYKWVMQKVASGVPRKEIIEEFNRLHELQPEVFCTRSGKKLSKGLLSHWISIANEVAV